MLQSYQEKLFHEEHVEDTLSLDTKSNAPLQDLHNLFIKYKLHAVGTAHATIANYLINFRMLLLFKPDITLQDLTENTMIEFLEFLNTREGKVGRQLIVRAYKNSSIAAVTGKLSAFFKWLVERNYIEVNPFEKIAYPDVSYTDRRVQPKRI